MTSKRWIDCTEELRGASEGMTPLHLCANCGITRTSTMRKGPLGERNLCNKCGLAYLKATCQDNRKRITIENLVTHKRKKKEPRLPFEPDKRWRWCYEFKPIQDPISYSVNHPHV